MSSHGAGRPTVLIFRKELLPWSETFIAAQGGALQRYRPVFVGYRLVQAGPDYLAGHERVLLADHTFSEGLGKAAIKALRRTPPRWRRALAAHRPALLHAHFGTNALDAIPIARALGVPLVVTYHGMDIATRPRNALDRWRRQRVFRAAHRVIAVSEFIAARLQEAGCPEDRIIVHHIGVDTRRFTPGDPAQRANAQILFVGRLVAKKGLTHLLRAMPRVQQAVPEAELVVVGDGPLCPRHEAEAARLGARCRFVGVQTPDEVRAWMQRSAVLCAPSVVTPTGNAEGLPITILEAQAAGLPVVAFPSGGSAEGIIDGETGWIVPPGDEATLAERLVALLTDDELRARFSTVARAHAVERFDLRRQTALLEEIYDDVLRAAGA